MALVLRDVATLPLRLARAARTTATLSERLGGAVQGAGPTALLLAPDAASDTPQALGVCWQPPAAFRAVCCSLPDFRKLRLPWPCCTGRQNSASPNSVSRPTRKSPVPRRAAGTTGAGMTSGVM
ncbi:hypothetical protein ACFSC4_14720 [Deinococcus malanensis]|uniref:hypothetical protein n=1 Tax=Deinococcus malanensis TaxID=1706855 RepID=UPI0036416E02